MEGAATSLFSSSVCKRPLQTVVAHDVFCRRAGRAVCPPPRASASRLFCITFSGALANRRRRPGSLSLIGSSPHKRTDTRHTNTPLCHTHLEDINTNALTHKRTNTQRKLALLMAFSRHQAAASLCDCGHRATATARATGRDSRAAAGSPDIIIHLTYFHVLATLLSRHGRS